jgi:hypothetical protein
MRASADTWLCIHVAPALVFAVFALLAFSQRARYAKAPRLRE